MKSEGHSVFISEYDMPADFELIWEKPITNSMNQVNTKKCVERLYII